MLGGAGAAKIENRLVQIGELFSEEFKEPLKERVLDVFNQEVEKLLAKKVDKLKGQKGDKGDQGEAGLNGADGKDGLNGLDGKDGLNGLDGKDGLNGKDGINGVNGKNGKDGINGKDGKDGINGKDGLNAEFDYDFAKKELASLFEEWKNNLGDLKGEKGEKGEQGEKGKDGAEYPTKETILISSELTQVAAFELKQSNYKALIQITAMGSQGTFFDAELRVLIQNLLGENRIKSNTNGASLPVNPENLNYLVKVEGGLLKVFLSGKAEEQIGVTVVLK
jgi:Ca2+-binding RTX toxin-like protein